MALVGWRELVDLPALGLRRVPAKIDTGARTSSLHAKVIESVERDGERWVRFAVDYGTTHVHQVCEAVRVDRRTIVSSNGEAQERLIVKTALKLGEQEFRAEFSLADRSDMVFPILIGRTALRRRFAVDSGHSYLQASPDERRRLLK